MFNFYDVDRVCAFNDVEYRVVKILDNNLLLVVNKEDLENQLYPLQTVVIPDDSPNETIS